ncbi:MAG: hypothetical protein LQ342_000986 [Letrouitia transgressa]|nr:MAG: hypothetical protein LQ342_000986 [Letrouitia transgressa]
MAARHLHHFRVADFDALADWDFGKVVKVGDSIPAYRYSATFLSTLRSNIHLSTELASLPSTPTLSTFQSPSLLPPPPLAMPPTNQLSKQPSPLPSISQSSSAAATTSSPLPTLTTHPATSPADRTTALRLITDSIAQQRQLAASALLTHPSLLSPFILLLAILSRLLDPPVFFTTAAGAIMIALLAVRTATAAYLRRAESVGLAWLENPNPTPFFFFAQAHGHDKGAAGGGGGGSVAARHSRTSSTSSAHSHSSSASSSSSPRAGNVEPTVTHEDILATSSGGGGKNGGRKRGGSRGDETVVLVTRWGEEIIGAVALRCPRKEKKAYLRAWTVRAKYRGKGVGRALLEEGVRYVWGRGIRGVEVEGGNIYSQKVLPDMFNKGFVEREVKARETLEDVVAAQRKGRN